MSACFNVRHIYHVVLARSSYLLPLQHVLAPAMHWDLTLLSPTQSLPCPRPERPLTLEPETFLPVQFGWQETVCDKLVVLLLGQAVLP